MNLPKTILVATDFGEASNAAFEYAVDLTEAFDAKLIALHAYELPVYGFPDGMIVPTSNTAASIMTSAKDALATTCARYVKHPEEIEQVVCEGNAAEEVQRVAEERHADLVVIGTHGRTGLAHALMGSIAEKIVRTVPQPVLTVHAPKS